MSKEEMIEEIKKMTVVELADLVKAIEEEFGVSAVAAAAPAAGAVAGGDAAAEKTSFNVVLANLLVIRELHFGCEIECSLLFV